jgi:CDP-diacylglycerol--glycerol-3-phosphate 3-phosphatidyltransferase
MAATGMERPFSWLLVAALASDAADGLLARAYNWTSRLSSLFDSLADAALMLVAAYGVWVFHSYVFDDYGIAIWAVLGLWALQHLLAMMRYGRPASFHTRLVRVAVTVFGLFLVTLFLLGFQPWLFFMAVALSLAGVCEELLLIAVVPEWTPDLRGGILEVMRRRRAERNQRLR